MTIDDTDKTGETKPPILGRPRLVLSSKIIEIGCMKMLQPPLARRRHPFDFKQLPLLCG
jgi:hypothetical protein